MFIGGEEKVEGIFTDLRKGRHAITAHTIPGRVVLQRLRNDIRYLRLDTGPCPPTSGFKFHLTTHNPAQALKIQDRPNHNLVSLLPITIESRLSTFDLNPSSSQAATWSFNRCDFPRAKSLFRDDSSIHSPNTK
ncbi:hypothetical protein PSTG_07292 [Puccinia striiformis f. sp. tritici PST-78]|uniref:Uncharacterized protein n=1 Tax=Puccinia striiformis f. sp. tritici PST-78 TaxID=1165861 RepID=A0A0L0VJB3_9BASI|nr:hypothetical protein PSTG_07292 [Puccinia striiformis f. sp. tritici PST-78]